MLRPERKEKNKEEKKVKRKKKKMMIKEKKKLSLLISQPLEIWYSSSLLSSTLLVFRLAFCLS